MTSKTAKRQCNGIGRCRILYTGKTFLSIYRGTHSLPTGSEIRRYHPGNFFSISCVAIAVKNLRRPRRRKNCDGSTYQSNNFGVSRKRFKPSMPGSKAQRLVFDNSYIVCTVLLRNFHCSLHVNFTQKMQKFGMYVCMYVHRVPPQKHVTTFSTITLTISVRLQ